jgi:hypothetical protein
MFSLFESPQDKLESERCFLGQVIHSAGSHAKLRWQKRLDAVESELELQEVMTDEDSESVR